MGSTIPAATLQAFRETRYGVDASTPFELRIGERSAALVELHRARGVAGSAFVTACNPGSVDIGTAANAPRMAQLRAELQAAGIPWIDGAGRHPANGWPPEPSVLALGIDRAAARALAARHGQDAFVWCGADSVPELDLLR
jgi:hypothetical protein